MEEIVEKEDCVGVEKMTREDVKSLRALGIEGCPGCMSDCPCCCICDWDEEEE